MGDWTRWGPPALTATFLFYLQFPDILLFSSPFLDQKSLPGWTPNSVWPLDLYNSSALSTRTFCFLSSQTQGSPLHQGYQHDISPPGTVSLAHFHYWISPTLLKAQLQPNNPHQRLPHPPATTPSWVLLELSLFPNFTCSAAPPPPSSFHKNSISF